MTVGNAVEVVGKVNSDLTVKVLRATDWGKDGECFFPGRVSWGTRAGKGRG